MTATEVKQNTRNFTFTYSACTSKEAKFVLEIPVEIPFRGCAQELTQRILSMFRIPVFIEQDLNDALSKFINEETEEFHNVRDDALLAAATAESTEACVREWERRLRTQRLEFSAPCGAPDDAVLAAAYHRLVHSPKLRPILMAERTYAAAVQKVIEERDLNVNSITESQTTEMEDKMRHLHTFTTEEEINELAARHFEEQSMVAGSWASQLAALQQAQRSQYRTWIMQALEEQQTSNSPTSPLSEDIEEVEEDSAEPPAPPEEPVLEESFTIHLGSQLKQMHNIRIMSADVMQFCKVKHTQDRMSVLTGLSLYSSDLCGLVLLMESPPPQHSRLARRLLRCCQQSTEFHFPQMDDQLEKIVEEVKEPVLARNASRQNSSDSSSQRRKESKLLQTGDIYITRHSNLAQTHVLFHLIADDSSLRSGDITSRHPVILGLRNILKAACYNDVTTLTLPVLLRHDMSEEMTVGWCTKRAELILKCVKGFMMEMASWGGSELKNIQFLVPPDMSEEVFSALQAMLPNIFRVSNPLKLKDS